MKKSIVLLSLGILSAALITANAQSETPAFPSLSGAMSKLFGDNLTFSSGLEMQTTDNAGKTITVPAQISFDHGNTRIDFNMSDIQGASLPAGAGDKLKSMGLDQMSMVARVDQKKAYVLYPGAQSYFSEQMSQADTQTNLDNVKLDATPVGKETIDGHNCVENKVVVTDANGEKHESTVWNASDLGNFPVKIQSSEHGRTSIMSFKNISRSKPDSSTFEVPTGYQKYNSAKALASAVMMKKMGGSLNPFGH